jgi:hypothetical protein
MDSGRHQTADPSEVYHRQPPRETAGLRISWAALRTVIALIAMVGVAAAGLSGVVSAFAKKADSTETRHLDDRLRSVESDVQLIKHDVADVGEDVRAIRDDQRMWIRAVRPDLPVAAPRYAAPGRSHE